MKILVTGGRGMLGHAIIEAFKEHELILTGSIELDVRNIKQVMNYAKRKPQLIIHTAGETDHVSAEFDPVACYMTNFTGTQNMVELARCLDIPIVYIGTCGIYNGSKESYTETDQPSPLNHYGRSKYYGELAVRAYPKHWIVRCGWGMGGGPGIEKKFINKIFQTIKSGVGVFPSISDVYGSPTYHPDLALTIKNLVLGISENRIFQSGANYGTYNCGGEKASRYEVAREFVECLGLLDRVKVQPLTFDEYHAIYPYEVIYTKCEVLDCSKLKATKLSAMRPWKEALKEYAQLWK
jgi:dTDP-4-dehydrorhamnose reductase